MTQPTRVDIDDIGSIVLLPEIFVAVPAEELLTIVIVGEVGGDNRECRRSSSEDNNDERRRGF